MAPQVNQNLYQPPYQMLPTANPNYQYMAHPGIQQPIMQPYMQGMPPQVNPIIPNNVYPPMYIPQPVIVDNRRNNCIRLIMIITFIVIFIIFAIMTTVIILSH